MEARALYRLGSAQSTEVKLNGKKWKPAHCIGSARHRPFGTYRNISGIVDRAKRSEGPKCGKGKQLLRSEEFSVFFSSSDLIFISQLAEIPGVARDSR
jgi:hypothetical protein